MPALALPVPSAPTLEASDHMGGDAGGIDLAGYQRLRILAECFADVQAMRIACMNRLERGGIPPATVTAIAADLDGLERRVGRTLRQCYRHVAPPGVRDWQQATAGVGEHLLARLLGHLGHPRLATPYAWLSEAPAAHVCGPSCGARRHLVAQRPYWRTIAQLRSYCGHGDPTRRRQRGLSQDDALALGSPQLKMLVWNCASAAMKGGRTTVAAETTVVPSAPPTPRAAAVAPTASDIQRTSGDGSAPMLTTDHPTTIPAASASPADDPAAHASTDDHVTSGGWAYRRLYEEARAQYATRTHAETCVRCGPSGRPAPVGSPWSKAHQHAAALRRVGKAILRDLWRAA